MTTITQQDREVSASLTPFLPLLQADIRRGGLDDGISVQAAAASRIETERRIVEWLRAEFQHLGFAPEILADRIECGEHREQQP